jgi:hypothetical protein
VTTTRLRLVLDVMTFSSLRMHALDSGDGIGF